MNDRSNRHLSDIEAATYLDRTLSAVDRERVESHLASCSECREHVMAGFKLTRSRDRRGRTTLLLAAVAAALLVIVFRPDVLTRFTKRGTQLRSTPGSFLPAYTPLGAQSEDARRFVWGSAGNVISYRLTITRGDGAAVWTQSGLDTVVTLPDSVVLSSGGRYFWVADALLNDGSSRSTGLHEFGAAK